MEKRVSKFTLRQNATRGEGRSGAISKKTFKLHKLLLQALNH